MMPEITRRGTSFRGAYLYYFHDKGARTTERIAWTHTANMMTGDVDKGWRVMAYTAKHQDSLKRASGQRATGAKMKKPVFAYSIAWHPEQRPAKEEMLKAANQSLEALGLTKHEVMMAAHCDEPQQHVHIMVNTVHPVTGLVANLEYTKRKVQDWATEYDREHGKVYCKMRDENYDKRKQGQHTRYADPNVTGAWEQSNDADGFVKLMEEKGYHLAQGRKRMVMVDPHGKTFNPTRILSAAYGKGAPDKFRDRMSSIDESSLPTPKDILKQRAKQDSKPAGNGENDRTAKPPKKTNKPDKYGATNDNGKPLKTQRENWRDIYDKRMAHVCKASDIGKLTPANDNRKRVDKKVTPPPQSDNDKFRQWKDRKFKLHNERTARAIDRKTMAHYDERSSMMASHDRRITARRDELEEFYQLKDKQRQIKRLQHSLDHPGFFQKLSNRFFGGEQRVTQQIEALKANSHSAKQRFDEQIKTMEKQRDLALEQLQQKQKEELLRLNQRLKQMEPNEKTLSQEWQKVAHRQQHRSRDSRPDRGRDGPGISR